MAIGLLSAISLEHRRYRSEADFEPYHARVREAVAKLPVSIDPWAGERVPLTAPAQRLLQPNAEYCVRFRDASVAGLADPSRTALLLLVQCKRTSDMRGHWPPRCYPAQGDVLERQIPHEWDVAGKKIKGIEYRFTRAVGALVLRTTVYNFIVLPEKGIVADMKDVEQSAEDYQQRYYGAAQFQLVFGGPLAEPENGKTRDEIFSQLLSPTVPVIETLSSGLAE